jgi:hypothetical protein
MSSLSYNDKQFSDNCTNNNVYSTSKILAIPVSVGELFDKYTILQIKRENIKDTNKLIKINKELQYLQVFINEYNPQTPTLNQCIGVLSNDDLIIELKTINETLWEIEEKIREKEKQKEFDTEFIELARNVYITNDKRNVIKQKIDNICLSELSDVKSYVNCIKN